MAREMDRAGKYVAAICAAPSVLIKAGVLQGRRATISPSGRAQVEACAKFSEDRVVVDKNLITSRSPRNGAGVCLEAGRDHGGQGEDAADQGPDAGDMPGGLGEKILEPVTRDNKN